MKNRSPFPIGLRLTLAFGFLAAPFGLFAQGSLTPSAAPAPTMKSLDQIQPRTPISSVPFVISQPGSYYLTTNLFASADAITINTNQVTLDLNGLTISSGPSVFSDAITLAAPGGNSDVTIFNGHIKGGTTIFNGTDFLIIGFFEGIGSTNILQNVRVSGVTVSGCINGINLGTSGSTIVESCAASICASTGINAQTVSRCTANQCGNLGINAITASDCSGTGVSDGIGLFANTAQNCWGVSSNGFGLRALGGAHNCYGQSTSSLGLFANTAENCYGYSISSIGLQAISAAQNCYGQSMSSSGLVAATANNCFGLSSNGTGLFVSDVATGCRGACPFGKGITAYIANSCRVASGTTNITYKYNMP